MNYPEVQDSALQQAQAEALKKVKEKFIKKGKKKEKKKAFTEAEMAEINEVFYSGKKNKIVEPWPPITHRGDGGFRL